MREFTHRKPKNVGTSTRRTGFGCAPRSIAMFRQCGYTLIEMLIVIVLLGISGALLVPNLVNRDSFNVQAAVRLIIGDLSFAQADALAHQEMRRVHFYADGHGYCLERITQTDLATPFDESSSTHDYIIDPLGRPGSNGRYITDFTTDTRFRGVSITEVSIDGSGRDLQYDSLGGTVMAGASSGVPGTGGTIIVQSGTERYQISIAPFTGKLTVVQL